MIGESLPTAGIFQALIDLENDGATLDFGTVSGKLEGDPVASELVPMLLMSDAVMGEQDRGNLRLITAQDCIDTLRGMKVDRRIDQLKSEVAAAERSGDNARVAQLSRSNRITKVARVQRPQPDVGPTAIKMFNCCWLAGGHANC
jgi:hypothetical protein